jgi:hypothetical protein
MSHLGIKCLSSFSLSTSISETVQAATMFESNGSWNRTTRHKPLSVALCPCFDCSRWLEVMHGTLTWTSFGAVDGKVLHGYCRRRGSWRQCRQVGLLILRRQVMSCNSRNSQCLPSPTENITRQPIQHWNLHFCSKLQTTHYRSWPLLQLYCLVIPYKWAEV